MMFANFRKVRRGMAVDHRVLFDRDRLVEIMQLFIIIMETRYFVELTSIVNIGIIHCVEKNSTYANFQSKIECI